MSKLNLPRLCAIHFRLGMVARRHQRASAILLLARLGKLDKSFSFPQTHRRFHGPCPK
jgi:hypothetical protein